MGGKLMAGLAATEALLVLIQTSPENQLNFDADPDPGITTSFTHASKLTFLTFIHRFPAVPVHIVLSLLSSSQVS